MVALTHHPGSGALALLHGSSVNTAGRSSGLTAPSGPAQQRLLAAALSAAAAGSGGRLGPANLACLSVHGTGTPLGDPIGAWRWSGSWGVEEAKAACFSEAH